MKLGHKLEEFDVINKRKMQKKNKQKNKTANK
jgi:hypothetical protein